ncbi:MAG: caspase family protein [Candidatus Cloacimonetes bacterium]|nr:caspase family protein [Candidatus Cloacimonadota bacterium]
MKARIILIFLILISGLSAFTPKEKIDMLLILKQNRFSSTRLQKEWNDRLESNRTENAFASQGSAKSLLEIRYSDDKDFEKALEKEYSTLINYSGACFDYRMNMIDFELEKERYNSRQKVILSFIKLKWLEDRKLIAIRIEGFDNIFAVESDSYINSFIDEYPDTCFVEVTKEYSGYSRWNWFNWKLHYGDNYVPFSTQRLETPDFSYFSNEILENPFETDIWEYEHIEYDTTGWEKVFSPSDSLLADYGKSNLAIIVGIPEYQYIPSYNYADNDAKAFSEKLQRMMYVPNENIFFSNDSKFTGFDELMSKYGWLSEKTGDDTLKLIIYFAGNAISSNGMGALLYHDFNIHASQKNSIRIDSLLTKLEQFHFKSITLILECNFNSLNNEDMLVTNDLDNLPPVMEMPTIPADVSILYGGNTRGKTALLADEKSNLFTWALINSLNDSADRNRDRYLTLNELEARISQLCNGWKEKLNIKQNPGLQTTNGNYIFLRLDNPYK